MKSCGHSLAAALIGLLLASPALRAEAVRGYVLQPTTGEQVADVEVAFYVRQEGRLGEILRKTTDAQGRFAFSGPFVEGGLEFVLAAFYRGVPHFTIPLEVGAQQEVIVEVYEPTRDGSDLRIASHNLFLALGGGELDVAHLVQIDNAGERTYVGRGGEGQRRVAEFALPANLFGLQSHAGNIVPAGDDLYFDTQPLPPGSTQITFTFSLDAQQLDQGYVHQVGYPTERLEIFLQPSTFQPGAPFADLGTVDLHGNQYRRLQLTGLEPGANVLVPLPLNRSQRWLLKWAALGVAGLGGILALILAGRTASAKAAPKALPDIRNLRQYADQLVDRLARLDDAHTECRDDPQYRAERDRLMEQARAVFHLLEEQDGRR